MDKRGKIFNTIIETINSRGYEEMQVDDVIDYTKDMYETEQFNDRFKSHLENLFVDIDDETTKDITQKIYDDMDIHIAHGRLPDSQFCDGNGIEIEGRYATLYRGENKIEKFHICHLFIILYRNTYWN